MRPGGVAKNGHDSVRVLRDPVREDHVRREGIEIARPGSFVLVAADERRFVEDPQPVVTAHQRDQARQVTVIDGVDESQGERDCRSGFRTPRRYPREVGFGNLRARQ
jgi:hypothetical protein